MSHRLKYFDQSSQNFSSEMEKCENLDDMIFLQRKYTPYFEEKIIIRLAEMNWDNLKKIREEKNNFKLTL